MDISELKATHELHDKFKGKWDFLIAAYEGTEALIDHGVIQKNERETPGSHKERVAEAYGYEYSEDVVDTVCRYLFEKDGSRDLGTYADNPLWGNFLDDCDLEGTDFDVYLTDAQRYASVFGCVGILVDKPSHNADTLADAQADGVYPYLSTYFPKFILDWAFERDMYGRPNLAYLKLLDEDGRYRLWWPDKWEVWRVDEKNKTAVLESTGDNPLNTIPFVWLYNLKSRHRCIGVSDIKGVARIDASIIRNNSHGEEVIKYAAFPQMRKPRRRAGTQDDTPEDVVAVTAVLEFDPEKGEAGKPDWLQPEVREVIKALLDWNERKVDEVYRKFKGASAKASDSKVAKSGEALRQEFKQLNSRLTAKSKNVEEAERAIIKFWLKWQGAGDTEFSIERPNKFAVEDLAADLENMLTGKAVIRSEMVRKELEKKAARLLLPGRSDAEYAEFDSDIEKGVPLPDVGQFGSQDGDEG